VAPLPFSQTGARVAFDVVLGIWVVSEWRVGLHSRLNRRGRSVDRGTRGAVILLVAAGIGGAFALAGNAQGAAIAEGQWLFFGAGLALIAVGIVIRQWSVTVLGSSFTTDVRVRPEQTVVERGPYRWVRHPSYTGLILIFLGIGLALGNWAALAVVVVVPTAGIVIRIGVEERALLDGLGEPYQRFAAGRPRLFPGVW